MARIRGFGRVLVALSGGVDSAVLLALSREALGPTKVHAVTAVSEAVPQRDIEDARAVARHLGVAHEALRTDELAVPGYRANAGDRCFHCRSELFRLLFGRARALGIPEVLYGAIADDVGDFRPGMKAADEWGVRAPLLDAGMEKGDVRALAHTLGLPVADKPAAACLASRIPHGTAVTSDRLRQVEMAEDGLHRLGFRQVRVRHHGDVARVELEPEELSRIADSALRSRVTEVVRAAGFRFCAVDLEGYRAGGGLNPSSAPSTSPARESGQ